MCPCAPYNSVHNFTLDWLAPNVMTRIAQITDLHLLQNPAELLRGVDTTLTLQTVLDDINLLPTRPDAIVATGDLAEDGAADTYLRLQAMLRATSIPCYVLPGNHDEPNTMRATFADPRVQFVDAVDVDEWSLIFLESQIEGAAHGELDAAKLAALEIHLEQIDTRPVMIALHHTPGLVCSSAGCQLGNASAFYDLLKRYPQVKVVIAGHTHTAVGESREALQVLTSPSTFAQVSHPQHSDQEQDFDTTHGMDFSRQGYRLLDLSADGSVKTSVRWVDQVKAA